MGEVTIWEFSGQENYFPVYHHFLRPSSQTLTLILFSLEDSPVIQVKQICFWINFLLAREASDTPSCKHIYLLVKILRIKDFLLAKECGQILLVATHVDTTRAIKTQHGEWIYPDAQKTLETVEKLIPDVPNLHSNVIIMDCNVPASYPFKQLKSMLVSLKQDCVEVSN